MRKVIITEAQYNRLLNILGESGFPNFNDGDIKEYPGSEVSTTEVVDDTNGDPDYGDQPTSDDFEDEISPQSWMASYRAGRGPRF